MAASGSGPSLDVTVISVVRPESEIPSGLHRVLARGIIFPSGWVRVEWNQLAYPPEQRLEHTHWSDYGSLADLQQVTGGDIIVDGQL